MCNSSSRSLISSSGLQGHHHVHVVQNIHTGKITIYINFFLNLMSTLKFFLQKRKPDFIQFCFIQIPGINVSNALLGGQLYARFQSLSLIQQ